MKITKLLPITLALLLGFSSAYAATEATNSEKSAVYQLNLAEFFDIEVTPPPAASDVSYSGNYTGISIDTDLVGKFQVISNTNTKDVYLYGTCEAEGEQPALYGALGGLKIVFTNQTTASTAAAVTYIRGGGAEPVSASSPNAIAFSLTVDSDHEEGPTNDILSSDFDDGQNVHYSIENGKATFTCTVSGSAVDNSFSTMDTNGTYKATLTMSNAAL